MCDVGRQLGTDYEQLPLKAKDEGGQVVEFVLGELDARQPKGGDGLVDRAVGLSAGIGFRNSAAVQEASRAIVAFARGDRTLGDRGPAAG